MKEFCGKVVKRDKGHRSCQSIRSCSAVIPTTGSSMKAAYMQSTTSNCYMCH